MYTHHIGRRLLQSANLRDATPDRTPAAFFDDVFFRIVFDDDQYLMTAGNSKFGQLVNNQKKLKAAAEKEGRLWNAEEKARARQGALADFHAAAAEVEEPHSHLVLGGYARGTDGTTSGQVTGIDHAATVDEVYLSWIGAAAGIGVAGGLVLLIDHDAVLEAVLDGWALYRRVLAETPDLKANQIETWNGRWLRHRFSADFRPDQPLEFVHSVINAKVPPYNIETVPWGRLLLALGRALGDAPVPAYVYSIGQTNSTIGFIPLHLGATGVLRESYADALAGYRALFNEAADALLVSPDRLDVVYDTGAGFARACTDGAIGLRAFEPAKIRDVLPNGKNKTVASVSPDAAQTPLLYLTWTLAMLGDQRHALNDRALTMAERLLDFETGARGGKTNLAKSVATALGSTSLTGLIDALTDIANTVRDASKTDLDETEVAETLEALDELVRACLDLTQERFYLFLALLRFQVALLRGKADHARKSLAA